LKISAIEGENVKVLNVLEINFSYCCSVRWFTSLRITTAFDGTKVALTEERWKHIVMRHPELDNKMARVIEVVSKPDELYVDSAGIIHVLKRLVQEISDYLVVIYRKENKEGYIRTAYYTSSRRKRRRYKRFKRLRPS